jgi:LEA14-like dessication related protein
VAIAVVALGTVGCATTEPMTAPEVTLVDLDFVGATVFESTLDIGVRVFNDNPEPIVIDGASLKLELDGRSFGKGTISQRFEVPRLDSVVQRLEMHLNHIAVATKLKGVFDSRTVRYAITGKIYLVTPAGSVRRMPIAKQGTIDLSGKPDAELPSDATLPTLVDDETREF